MSDQEISWAEDKFCMYKLELTGGFFTALFQAAFSADSENKAKLAKGFPEIVNVIDRYRTEKGYWTDLQTRWNNKHPNHQILS